MNSHINITTIDKYTAREYGIDDYDEMVNFATWLKNQQVKFTDGKQALQVYRDQEETPTIQTQKQPRYTERSFKSRQQLNSFLRRHGYTWHKIAPMSEYEESQYGESYRWQLYSNNERPVTVQEALNEIG